MTQTGKKGGWAWSAQEKDPGTKYAVVIGIGKYQDRRIPSLHYARADAQAIYDILTNPQYGNFPKENVRLLLDKDATEANIKEAIGLWLSSRAEPEDMVIIYFGGHGGRERKKSYWVTYDADVDKLFATALSNDDVVGMLDLVESKKMVTFLDACYSSSTVNRTRKERELVPEGIFDRFSGEGRVTITASEGKELSLELPDLGHGVFTYYLIDALKGKADNDRDGMVTLDEVWDFVKNRVTNYARRHNHPQRPRFITPEGYTPGIALSKNPQVIGIKAQRIASLTGIMARKEITSEEFLEARRLLSGDLRNDKEKQLLTFVELLADGKITVADYQESRRIILEGKSPPPALPSATPAPSTEAEKPGGIASIPQTIIGKDGAEMILIPAGEFLMGSPAGEGDDDEHPQHRVYQHAFYIDKYEVTNAQFERFVNETGYKTDAEKEGWGWVYSGGTEWKKVSGANWRHPFGPGSDLGGKRSHPVVQVNWNDANAYCRWAGKRQPTEAEREKAGRGTDGRKYPWGNDFDCKEGNFDDETKYDSYTVPGGEGCDGYVETAPVGNFPSGASPYGVLDMAGNVWEWVADWSGEDYYRSSPYRNPKGPDKGEYRVLRGGSWFTRANSLRAALRLWSRPAFRSYYLGCRCAQD